MTTQNKISKGRGAAEKTPVRLVKHFDRFRPEFTLRQICRMTGRGYGVLYNAAREGTLECSQSRPGTVMFFTMAAINKYMALKRPTMGRRPKKIGRR
jgi:hypothetical protein